jgi:hypothetical protein
MRIKFAINGATGSNSITGSGQVGSTSSSNSNNSVTSSNRQPLQPPQPKSSTPLGSSGSSPKPMTPSGTQPLGNPIGVNNQNNQTGVQNQPSQQQPNTSNMFGSFASGAKMMTSPNFWKATSNYNTVKDDNVPWTDPRKIESAYALRDYVRSDPNASALLQQNPAMKSHIDNQMRFLDSPIAPMVRHGVPILNKLTGTPEQFGQFLKLPMVSDFAKPFISTAGLPGLMMAYSYLSGDSNKWKNWRTLTSGLNNPNNPRSQELQNLFSKFKM